jgi:lysozyme
MNPANANLHISDAGLALIKKYEGWYPKAYQDPVGVWTIGWGTTNMGPNGQVVWPGRQITKEEGTAFLAKDMEYFEEKVKALVTVPLTQHQFDALVSFTYNAGEGNLKKSTLLKLLNRGNYEGALAQFANWNRARDRNTGQMITLRGLTNRRRDEADLFMRPDDMPVRPAVIKKAENTVYEDPEANTGTVQAVSAYKKPWGDAFKEVFRYSETFKVYMIGLGGTVATAGQMIEPILKNPAALIGLGIVILAICAAVFLKVRDTSEGR